MIELAADSFHAHNIRYFRKQREYLVFSNVLDSSLGFDDIGNICPFLLVSMVFQ